MYSTSGTAPDRETQAPAVAADAVIAIHGTFAKEAPWVQPNSSFFRVLTTEAARPLSTHSFPWSGSNSHEARIKAGRELAGFVDQLCKSSGIERVWCVTHSHGGNVALYALRDERFASRIAGIAFLGTPFLHLSRRNAARFCYVFTQTISWLLLFPIYAPFIIYPLTMAALAIGPLFWAFQLFIGNGLGALVYLKYRSRVRQYAEGKLLKMLLRKQDEIFQKLSQPKPCCPTFVATIARDEPALWLRSVDQISILPWRGFAIAARVVAALVVTYLVLGFAELFFDDTLNKLHATDPLFAVAVGVPMLIVVAPLLATPFLAFLRGAPIAFGSEGLIAANTLRVRPSQLPWWNGPNVQITWYPPNREITCLRHSFFYADPAVITDIAAWIKTNGRLNVRPPPTSPNPPPLPIWWRRWAIPAVVSLATALAYVSLTLFKLGSLTGEHHDFAANVPTIQSKFVSPTLQIDEPFEKNRGWFDPVGSPTVRDATIQIRRGASCIVQGQASLVNWDTSLDIVLHELRPLLKTEEADVWFKKRTVEIEGKLFFDEYQVDIWNWNSSHGKQVKFLRRFQNALPTKTARLALRVWNGSDTPARVTAELYVDCSPR